MARQERRLRLQPGYGLEGAIPDAIASRLIEEVLEPAFKQERYYVGLEAVTTQLMRLARGESASFARSPKLSGVAPIPFKVFACWLLGLWSLLLLRQCWRHSGPSGLWAWRKSEWWLKPNRPAAHKRAFRRRTKPLHPPIPTGTTTAIVAAIAAAVPIPVAVPAPTATGAGAVAVGVGRVVTGKNHPWIVPLMK
ncbi:TPM domain-containing protein [Hymenobacter terrenus]|uniref:TPM domain-containing protein n=1 Tax=Hymenobacter terrenus TaxID=1629124 RepID=UPI000698E10E|nr:TPM domain-containing protein [Hymenobacter terrenus]